MSNRAFGLAAVNLETPMEAISQLRHAVLELGFKGAPQFPTNCREYPPHQDWDFFLGSGISPPQVLCIILCLPNASNTTSHFARKLDILVSHSSVTAEKASPAWPRPQDHFATARSAAQSPILIKLPSTSLTSKLLAATSVHWDLSIFNFPQASISFKKKEVEYLWNFSFFFCFSFFLHMICLTSVSFFVCFWQGIRGQRRWSLAAGNIGMWVSDLGSEGVAWHWPVCYTFYSTNDQGKERCVTAIPLLILLYCCGRLFFKWLCSEKVAKCGLLGGRGRRSGEFR